LVLDEATSSLDPATEQRLLIAASQAFEGRTVITIAVSFNNFTMYSFGPLIHTIWFLCAIAWTFLYFITVEKS
jgi:acetylornithine/succinyldiaminopimelate/putrescine aminotransferase